MVKKERSIDIKLDKNHIVLYFTIVACVILAFYVAFVIRTTVVYTHLFYIPIILAGMWYYKKAVYVAFGLGVVHILVTFFSPPPLSIDVFGRAVIFIVVAYVIGFVSEQRAEGEDALRESEEKYSAFFKTSRDPVFITSKEGRGIDVNDAAVELFGYEDRDELLKVNVPDLYKNPEERRRHTQLIDQQGFTKDFAVNLRRKDGSIIKTIITSVIKKDGNGNVIGYHETIRDITERKRMEEERERIFKDLEVKNSEMERFVYTVSHDLRSPLITIQGYTELLRKDIERNETEQVETDLKYIANAATTMDLLLKDTLQLSRVGRVTNPPEDVPFGEIVKEALELIAEHIKSSGVDVSMAKDFPTVHVDRMRIREVLVNLIENSINYRGEQPSPKINMGYRVYGGEIVFFVQDNGIGMDKSQHKKVFDLFYKVDKSSSKGTGAGLAIVKRIIEVQGGRIWIESEKGKGCTICFTLPIV